MIILEYTGIKSLNTQRFLEQTTVVRYLIDQALAGSTRVIQPQDLSSEVTEESLDSNLQTASEQIQIQITGSNSHSKLAYEQTRERV